MKLERVKLADVFPLEDEYGNQFASRDYSTKENQEHVARLAESMRAKGEPDEPIRLVRDGQVYRILAGNSRVRAMGKLGTAECWAVIDDEITVKEALAIVMRTDTKKKYEPVEASRFVHQMFLFDSDDYVSENALIDKEKVRKMRRVLEKAGDAVEDMTLERWARLEEFADDDEAFEELINCSERDFGWKADRVRRRKEAREKVAALEQEVERMAALGALTLFADMDRAADAGYADAYFNVMSVDGLRRARDRYAAFAWGVDYEGERVLRSLAAKAADEPAVDPELAARAERLSGICADVIADAEAWYAGFVGRGEASKAGEVSARCADAYKEGVMVDYDASWQSLDSDDSPFRKASEMALSAADYALGWFAWAPADELSAKQLLTVLQGGESYRTRDDALAMLDFMEALAESGWPGGNDAVELMGALEEYRDAGSEGGE